MKNFGKRKIRETVRENYKRIALSKSSSCCNASSCCESNEKTKLDSQTEALGYSAEQVKNVPKDSNMGLGCGNPHGMASIQVGETVLDLGSGGGLDCFLASKTVGSSGKVIGVDMTQEMISKARENAEKGGYTNTDFRLGEIEHLPVADATVDVIISNCVINLSPEKEKVFKEAYRVLKPGGRLAISDIVSSVDLPEKIRGDLSLYSSCMVGAESIKTIYRLLEKVGFKEINIEPKDKSREFIKEWMPGKGIENYVVSANIEAVK